MESTNYSLNTNQTNNRNSNPEPWTAQSLAAIRTTARDFANPVDYEHPYPSMASFADHLALSYDANRTRHSYYRQLRLIHQHLGCDPATITEAQLRDYFLFVKLKKQRTPKSIRQARAAASMFFINLLGHADWTVFSPIVIQRPKPTACASNCIREKRSNSANPLQLCPMKSARGVARLVPSAVNPPKWSFAWLHGPRGPPPTPHPEPSTSLAA